MNKDYENGIRQRVFRTTLRGGQHYYEVGIDYNDGRGWWFGLADFCNGAWAGLTEEEKQNARTRVLKI